MGVAFKAPGKFIILQNLLGNKSCFYAAFRFGIDYTRNPTGNIAFKILGYADSEDEAKKKIVKVLV